MAMAIFSKSYLLFFLMFIQAITVNYYSFYSVAKSGTEYFCIQKRPSTSYTSSAIGRFSDLRFLNVTITVNGKTLGPNHNDKNAELNLLIGSLGKKQYMVAEKGSGRKYTNQLYTFNGHEEEIATFKDGFGNKYEMKVDRKGFKLKYFIGGKFKELTCPIVYATGNYSGTIDDKGAVYNDPSYHSHWSDEMLECTQTQFDVDCTMSEDVLNGFFVLYAAIMLFSIVLMLATLTDYKRNLILRKYKSVKNKLTLGEKWGDFCNPITSNPTLYKRNDSYYTLSYGLSERKAGVLDRCLIDNAGRYYLMGNELSISTNNNHTIYSISDEIRDEIGYYFALCNFSHRNCVVVGNHHITTESALMRMMNGEILMSKVVQDEGFYANDVYASEVALLTKLFNIKKSTIAFLLEHNMRFFKERNMQPLIKLLQNKSDHYHSPDGINNSTWKFYGSDFHHIMKKYQKINVFRQVKWVESPRLKEMNSFIDGGNSIEIIDDEVLDVRIVEPKKDPFISTAMDCAIGEIDYVLNKTVNESVNNFPMPVNPNSDEDSFMNVGELLINETNKHLRSLKEIGQSLGKQSYLDALKTKQIDFAKSMNELVADSEKKLKAGLEPLHFKRTSERKDKKQKRVFDLYTQGVVLAETNAHLIRREKMLSDFTLEEQRELVENKISYVFNKRLNKFDIIDKIRDITDISSVVAATHISLMNYFDVLSNLKEEDETKTKSGPEQRMQLNVSDLVKNVVKKVKKNHSKKGARKIRNAAKRRNMPRKVPDSGGLRLKDAFLHKDFHENLKVAGLLCNTGCNTIAELKTKMVDLDVSRCKPRAVHILYHEIIKMRKALFNPNKRKTEDNDDEKKAFTMVRVNKLEEIVKSNDPNCELIRNLITLGNLNPVDLFQRYERYDLFSNSK